MRVAKLSMLIVVALCLVPAAAGAQAGNGELVGRAVDETGAALPGVTVTLHPGCRCQDCSDPARCDCCPDAVVRVTNAKGEFSFLSVSAGTYSLAASLEGSSASVQDVVVEPGTTTRVDVTLARPR